MSQYQERFSGRPWRPERTIVRALLILVVIVLLAAIAGCALGPNAAAPTVTSAPTVSSIQPLAMPTFPPTSAPPPAAAGFKSFVGSGAPFVVQYPNDWSVDNEEASGRIVSFFSPDSAASATVLYGDGSTVSPSEAIDQFIAGSLTDAKVIGKTQNPDGSITAEVEQTESGQGGRVHGYVRLILSREAFYMVMFNAHVDQFQKYQSTGQLIIQSLKVVR